MNQGMLETIAAIVQGAALGGLVYCFYVLGQRRGYIEGHRDGRRFQQDESETDMWWAEYIEQERQRRIQDGED